MRLTILFCLSFELLVTSNCLVRYGAIRGPIRDAIESGAAADYNKENCVWRRGNDRDICPDPDVHVYLYTPGRQRRMLDSLKSSDWLRQDYEHTKENVFLIHGYAGESLFSLSCLLI